MARTLNQQIDVVLTVGELLLLVCIIFDLITVDCSSSVETYSLRSCPRATVAFVALVLADACFLASYLRSPTRRLSAHWRHLLLFSTSSCILAIMIILHSLGSSYILDNNLRFYFGSILGFALLLTWLKTLVIFPLNLPPVHPVKRGPHAPCIGTHSFTIPIANPDDPTGAPYRAAVQVWFPLPQPPPSAAPSLLWTSGNPSTQGTEAHTLLEAICKEFKQAWFVLSHLSLSRHSHPAIYYSSQHHDEHAEHGQYSQSSQPGQHQNAQLSAEAVADLMGMMEGRAPVSISPSASPSPSPFSSGRPVAIYSHGMFSWRQLATSTVAHLVSHGFVVFALDHGPSAMVARIPSHGPTEGAGPSMPSTQAGAEAGAEAGADMASAAAAAAAPSSAASAEPKTATSGKRDPTSICTVDFNFRLPKGLSNTPQEHAFYNAGLERRTQEVLALMDYIEAERAGRLRGYSLDPSRLHLFGHSFGSGTVASVCARDARPVSAVLLDSWMFPLSDADMEAGSKRASVLSLSSELWDIGATQVPRRSRFMESTRRNAGAETETFQLKIVGTNHQNFCDIYMLADKALLAGMIGTVDPYAATRSINALLCDFFLRCHAHTQAHTHAHAHEDSNGPSLCRDEGEGQGQGGDEVCLNLPPAPSLALTEDSQQDQRGRPPTPQPQSPTKHPQQQHQGSADGEYVRLVRFLGCAEGGGAGLGDALLDRLCVGEEGGGACDRV